MWFDLSRVIIISHSRATRGRNKEDDSEEEEEEEEEEDGEGGRAEESNDNNGISPTFDPCVTEDTEQTRGETWTSATKEGDPELEGDTCPDPATCPVPAASISNASKARVVVERVREQPRKT